jgi:DNA-binding transcriptional regulator YhcF (GntR family)
MGWIFDGSRPIYVQLLEQIRLRIVCGVYRPGEKLPSVRELAQEAAVNPNTMQKALAELERTGLIYAQRTSGRFVTENEKQIRSSRLEIALEKVEAFITAMQELGYTREEISALIRQDEEACQAILSGEAKDENQNKQAEEGEV